MTAILNIRNYLIAALLLLYCSNTHSASTPPTEDIHFLAEHLAESAQDARYFAMPWPVGNYQNQKWTPVVSVATARADIDFANTQGLLFTLGVSTALSNTWALDILAYYDTFDVSGSATSNSLSPFSLRNVPLDLPETAIFFNPRGQFIHTGIGLVASHELEFGETWHWDMLGGILFEQLKLSDYQFNYELTGGVNAAETGVLDHSGNNTLIYGVIGIQSRKIFSSSYEIIPRAILGAPLKKGDFTSRLTGTGFDLSTASTGAAPHPIGDLFVYLGMAVLDISSHFETDIGAILGYESFEVATHEGIDSALIVSLTWRME